MISKFLTFLTEDFLVEAASSSVASDDKGKLHELLLAKYLHPNQQLPEHHRSMSEIEGHAGTPTQVHDKLKAKIGEEAYNEIDSHAQSTAKALIDHLKKNGHINKDISIGDVHWTSNRDMPNKPGDHEKTTGVKDVNSNADIIATLKDKKGNIVGYHGISAKYGTNKEPNYKNPGMDTLEKMSGLESGTINKMMQKHHNDMEKLGYNGVVDDRHAKYKIDVMGPDKAKEEKARLDTLVKTGRKLSGKEKYLHSNLDTYLKAYKGSSDKAGFLAAAKERVNTSEDSARGARAAVAKRITDSLDDKTKATGNQDKALRNMLKEHLSPPTVIPHTVAHSWVQEEGSSVPIVKNAESVANDHLDKFEGLHVAKDKAGGSITIRGYNKATNKLTNVATYGLKSQSGPHKNINGTLQLK